LVSSIWFSARIKRAAPTRLQPSEFYRKSWEKRYRTCGKYLRSAAQSMLIRDRQGGECGAVRYVQLFIDIVQMDLDCALAEVDSASNFLIAQAFSYHEHDLLFARCQSAFKPVGLIPARGTMPERGLDQICGEPLLPRRHVANAIYERVG